LTFNQARKNGLKIKAWSKGIVVQHKEIVELTEKNVDWGIEIKKIPQVKSRLLFNIQQTEPVKTQ
jgi:antirestriction protein ArdC